MEQENLTTIYLIEKGWIDYLENRDADGYEPFSFKYSEKEAKEFCDSKGYWTKNDCWSVKYYPDEKMPKYRYREIKHIN